MDPRVRILLRRSKTGREVLSLVQNATRAVLRDNTRLSRQSKEIAAHGSVATLKLFGLNYRLDLALMNDFLIFEQLGREGLYESETSRFFLTTVEPGQCFVDVGANNGYYTLLAASRVGPEGSVMSFEPNPEAFQRLTRNVELNRLKNVRTFQVALSDGTREGQLFCPAEGDGLSSLTPLPDSRPIAIHELPFDSLPCPRRVDVVKIDVEGAELDVLKGMERTVAANPRIKVVAEWNSRYASEQTYRRLSESYRVSRIAHARRNGYSLVPIADAAELPGLCNILLTPHQ